MFRFAIAIFVVGAWACDSGSIAAPDVGAGTGSATELDAAALDARAPDTAAPDARAPIVGALDAGARDTGAPDPRIPDADASDAGAPDAGAPDAGAPKPPRIQVFSRTSGFRHDSIDPARAAIVAIAAEHGASIQHTEDPAVLTARLSQTDVVVFLMTTGDVLDPAQQTAFERFIRDGGGFVGVHSAADTEYDWPFYGELNGAWFKDHPAVQKAAVIVEAAGDPLVSFLPRTWERTDEWYNFRTNPRPEVTVLLRLDESTYSGGNMGADHPIAWSRKIDAGRAFYTGLGHTRESWEEPLMLMHVERALLWAAGR